MNARAFQIAELIASVRKLDPSRDRASIQPIIQGMTKNASGGPKSPCGKPLVRIERGVYAISGTNDIIEPPHPSRPKGRHPRARIISPPELTARLGDLLQNFDTYVATYDAQVPFRRGEQYQLHRSTIDRRRELGSAIAAATDPAFTDLLRQTLFAWGIGKRASRLIPLVDFQSRLAAFAPQFATLDQFSLEDPTLPVAKVSAMIDELITHIGVVDNSARIVAGTKTLHHLLPDLVPPMDRAWTGAFFGWSSLDPTLHQTQIFSEAFAAAAQIAATARPSRLVGAGWRTSVGKLFDNALIGFCKTSGIGG